MKQLGFKKTISWYVSLFLRPFIDFYYNYGLTRASVLSYVLCANLIIFVYFFMTFGVTVTIDPLVSPSSARRFLELHFLWPMAEKVLIEKVPPGFGETPGSLISNESFEAALKKYCEQHKTDVATLKDEGKLQVKNFSITDALGTAMYEATLTFYDQRSTSHPLGIGFFIILAMAYIALLLNIKSNLAESVSPLIWGNLPLANRRSEIMKILWRIPDTNALKSRIYLFFMMPLLIVFAITLLSAGQKFVDLLMDPYSTANIALTGIFSLVVTTILFTTLYQLHAKGISQKNAAMGAFIAASLWLGGRWFFTMYGALSLHRNLRNLAFIPLSLTWFYYFCTVFLFGLYLAQTFENPNLSSTARSWAMRDISVYNRYPILAAWVRLDFLYRLALSRYEEFRPPFISMSMRHDTAEEIAKNSNQSPIFVRECILEMLSRHSSTFHIEVEWDRQYCKLKSPPEEIDVMPLLTDPEDIRVMHGEMQDYWFGNFIMGTYGHYWGVKPLLLSDVYRSYKEFQNQAKKPAIPEASEVEKPQNA